MRAKLNYLIVRTDLEQKEKHKVTRDDGSTVELYLGRAFNPNMRERNPCVCEVLHNPNENYPYIKEGDLLVLHYNFFDNINFVLDKQGSIATLSIPLFNKEFNNTTQEHEWNINHLVFGKIVDGEIIPLCSNLICERIKMPQVSEIIANPIEKTYPDRVKCLRVSPEIDYVKEGDTLLINKMGDYEIIYHWDGRERRAIKTWSYDVKAIIHE